MIFMSFGLLTVDGENEFTPVSTYVIDGLAYVLPSSVVRNLVYSQYGCLQIPQEP